MSTAHERITQLLDRWHASVERHTRYLSLDDAEYAKVEDWPAHQRPARWLIEHARTRLLELRRIAGDRLSRGDAEFAEALELMAFLANLVGAENGICARSANAWRRCGAWRRRRWALPRRPGWAITSAPARRIGACSMSSAGRGACGAWWWRAGMSRAMRMARPASCSNRRGIMPSNLG